MLRNLCFRWREFKMPPTPIITKQDILNAGIQLIRENGIRSVNARSLAKSLSCSTKPLFRIYKNMEELKKDIKKELDNYYNDFMEKNMTNENRLLSQGISYIEFARSEKMIFSSLFMNMTMAGSSLQDIIHAEWNRASIENAKALTGLSTEKAEILFINFWLYSHGIATQIVSNDIDIPLDLVKKLLKNAFNRFSLETV
jgi:AcrR family transcriptional regulator